jgi:predicted unusual protein kinase regulating ubiquinone biosynthesis (AarF/ABC1/UbiB family)
VNDFNDNSTITGQIKRYAQVGGSMSGLAVKFAANRFLGTKMDKEKHSVDLKNALGGLKGPLMKAAQLLATIPEALPKEYAQELRQLQSNAPAMGWPFVKRRMGGELGAGWTGKFASFDREAIAAASLGQVHRSVGLDGKQLACKLQYPDMSSAVEADLKQLQMVFAAYRQYDKAIDPREIFKELSERLREELDYTLEAKHAHLYQIMLADMPEVEVPEIVSELSTERLLTMSWLEGRPLMERIAETNDLEDRNKMAVNMFNAWYHPFYNYGAIHGDPHLGNYLIKDDYSVSLLDFGCIRVFRPEFVEAVINLYKALRDGDEALAVASYETWGFKNLTKEMLDALNLWASFVYGPLMEDKPRLISETSSTEFGAEVAGNVHAELKKLGGVTVPREFVFMDRAAIGLGSVFMHLDAEVNWHRLFHEMIEDFDVNKLRARQTAAMLEAGLDPAA